MTRIDVNPKDYPRCAVCDMPVEDFYILELDNGLMLMVECHRATESVKLSPDDLQSATIETIEFGRAFETRE